MHLILFDHIIQLDSLAPVIDLLRKEKNKIIILNTNPLYNYNNNKLIKYFKDKDIKFISFPSTNLINKIKILFLKLITLLPKKQLLKFTGLWFRVGNGHYLDKDEFIKFIKENDIKIVSIPNDWQTILTNSSRTYGESNNLDVNKILDDLYRDSMKLSKKRLLSITFYNLVKELYGVKIANYVKDAYPYYSEIFVINAYNGLMMLQGDLSNNNKFYILGGGLSLLIDKMRKDFISSGGKIVLRHELKNLDYNDEGKFAVKLQNLISYETIVVQCSHLVLACDGLSLQKMRFLKKFEITDMLKAVQVQPLLRTFAIYDKCWFKDLPKVVTNEMIRYIIPIDYKKGVIMISYTDGAYAKFWKKLLGNDVQQIKELNKQLRKLFPNRTIEDPKEIYNYYWEQGASYWKPNYNTDKIRDKLLKPTKLNLFICGDSYSSHQAWMEGALLTSNKLFTEHF